MAARKPGVPAGILEHGAKLWRDIVKPYDLRPDELRVLEDACRTRDLLARLEAEFEAAPDWIVPGSQGQPVVNPLISEIRQQRAGFAALMRQLKLPDLDGAAKPAAADMTEKRRKAGQASWAARSQDMEKAVAQMRSNGAAGRRTVVRG